MANSTWNVGFHLRSPKNWLNDPNGTCQFRGTYRFFYQYDHDWPNVDQKAWGLFASEDLVHWRYEGVSIEPSIDEDRHGVYSGCSLIERGAAADGGDRLRAFYTGNVINPGPHHSPLDGGFVHEGREAYEITCTSDDGIHFGPKTVVMRPRDYPDYCGLHVRDPKVWEQDGRLHMILGARDRGDMGMCILFDSDDGISWQYRHGIRPAYPFGYMWECPNIVQLDGYEYLAVSPQGLPRQRDRWHNLWQAGYFPLDGRVLDTHVLDERTFVEWDHGHDFYAPQVFCDDAGRQILVGWMGTFDRTYTSAPDDIDWIHCMTVPRVLTRDSRTGLLLQQPVCELETIRRDELSLASGSISLEGRMADIVLDGILGEGSLVFDESFAIYYVKGRLGIRYLVPEHSAGRDERSIPLEELRSLRVLVDGSAVEIYANDGAEVFSSRWFCAEEPSLRVRCGFEAQRATVWRMEDTMSEMYATAVAPDLKMPGLKR